MMSSRYLHFPFYISLSMRTHLISM